MTDLPNLKNVQLPFGVTLNGLMASYMSIEDYFGDGADQWGERAKATETNTVWQVHWYPKTPSGSYKVLASSLEVVLKAIAEIQEQVA